MVQEAVVVQEARSVMDKAELTQEVHHQAQLVAEFQTEEVVVLVDMPLLMVLLAKLVVVVAVALLLFVTNFQILCLLSGIGGNNVRQDGDYRIHEWVTVAHHVVGFQVTRAGYCDILIVGGVKLPKTRGV
jgi:hypothetical protein